MSYCLNIVAATVTLGVSHRGVGHAMNLVAARSPVHWWVSRRAEHAMTTC
jgi:hypothetical protein